MVSLQALSRKSSYALQLLLVLLAATFHTTYAARDDDPRPNFIFIFADDMGFGDLKSYGHPYAITDNLDRLATEGTRFTQFHVTGNVCPNSRAGLMTSRNPSWFPNYTEDYGFMGVPTVTNILKDAGYLTGHIGKWNIGPTPPDDAAAYGPYGIDDLRLTKNAGDTDPAGRERLRFDEAVEFVERHQDKPFYVNIWMTATHGPIAPPPQLVRPFRNLQVDRSKFGPYIQDKFDDIVKQGGTVNESMRQYLGVVYGVDLQVGRLLDKLDELELTDNTVVVFSSDNGPAFLGSSIANAGWAGGLRGGKHDYYQGGIVVPFLVRWPGHVPANKVNDQSFLSALDWLPTVGSMAGADVPFDFIEGEDMSDVFLGSDRSRTNPTFWRPLQRMCCVTMRAGNWKLLDNLRELYDLEADPTETNNIYNDHPDIVADMKESIKLWEATLPNDHARMPREVLPFDPDVAVKEIGPPDFLKIVAPTVAPTTLPPTASPTTLPPTASPTTAAPTASPTTAPPTRAPTPKPTPTDLPTTGDLVTKEGEEGDLGGDNPATDTNGDGTTTAAESAAVVSLCSRTIITMVMTAAASAAWMLL